MYDISSLYNNFNIGKKTRKDSDVTKNTSLSAGMRVTKDFDKHKSVFNAARNFNIGKNLVDYVQLKDSLTGKTYYVPKSDVPELRANQLKILKEDVTKTQDELERRIASWHNTSKKLRGYMQTVKSGIMPVTNEPLPKQKGIKQSLYDAYLDSIRHMHSKVSESRKHLKAAKKALNDFYNTQSNNSETEKLKSALRSFADPDGLLNAIGYEGVRNMLLTDDELTDYFKELKDIKAGLKTPADYVSFAFNDTSIQNTFVFHVDCSGGHIASLDYSLLFGNEQGGLLKVTFSNRGDVIVYFGVPGNVAGELFHYAEYNVMAPAEYTRTGRIRERHMVGVAFWNYVRVRGRGNFHNTRYPATYIIDNSTGNPVGRPYATNEFGAPLYYNDVQTAKHSSDLVSNYIHNPLLNDDNTLNKTALKDYKDQLKDNIDDVIYDLTDPTSDMRSNLIYDMHDNDYYTKQLDETIKNLKNLPTNARYMDKVDALDPLFNAIDKGFYSPLLRYKNDKFTTEEMNIAINRVKDPSVREYLKSLPNDKRLEAYKDYMNKYIQQHAKKDNEIIL